MTLSPFKLLALSSLLLGFTSCQSSSWSFPPKRTGAPFADSFPDPAVLLEARDVSALRKKLNRSPLPASEEHHQRLLALVAGVDSLRAENLALVTEAVALPSRMKGGVAEKGSVRTSITIGSDSMTTFSREEGPYSHYVDELLLLGAPKVQDLNPKKLGRLMASTQKRETVVALYDLLGASCDDGSPKALEQFMDSACFDEVRTDLLIGSLIPSGNMSQERAETALDSLSFDDGRIEFLDAWAPTVASIPADRLPEVIGSFSFDDGRESAARTVARSSVGTLDGETMRECLDELSFDEGRCKVARALAPHVRIQNANTLPDLIGVASFDEGRTEILRSAATCLSTPEGLNGSVAKQCLQEFSFDEGREDAMIILGPLVQFTALSEVQALLSVASFDDGKVELLRSSAPRISSVKGSARELKDLLESFSFDDGRNQALLLVAHSFKSLPPSDLWDVLDDAYSFEDGRREAAKRLGLR